MKKKKPYRINLIHNGSNPKEVINKIVRDEWTKILNMNGLVALIG